MRYSLETLCVHSGTIDDRLTWGTRSPLFPSNSHKHLVAQEDLYPRHSNVANQRAVAEKLRDLEQGEKALVFSSGMAAISTALLSHLRHGDHLIMQKGIYSGTFRFAANHLPKIGVEVSLVAGSKRDDFLSQMRPNTRAIYIETPTNPLLEVLDIEMIAEVAALHGLTTFIDNTIATPINQTPIRYGIDIVLHSATKFLGGHGDITAGVAIGSESHILPMIEYVNDFGGCLNPQTCHLLERSLLTLAIRMAKVNENAMKLAVLLNEHPSVTAVHYPGLTSHPSHEVAKRQMAGFGGVLSFELDPRIDVTAFQNRLKLVVPANSMGEATTTLNSPFQASTSFRSLVAEQRRNVDVSHQLIRMSAGIEGFDDLSLDLLQALAP
ncbi:trans-sulfuration enzyme family protein [Mesorhizobium sp. IMUNJ 23033]|uniref:trans-sulfuration enzyme family protein n=1 Tax=Mesorhizobium sp. IMUNJ 23033 TaxID=3378039 RepID=UPI00384ABA74